MSKNSFGSVLIFLLLIWIPGSCAWALSEAEVAQHLQPKLNMNGLRQMGPQVVPVLVSLYEKEKDPQRRARIAKAFYELGWKSEEAKNALLQDITTRHPGLRLEVQWALGRVSNDDQIVPTLLDIMRHDQNALFRDKAACALASDQIHLSPVQRFGLISGLVEALGDDNPQVRHISILALKIQTGQTKGYDPNASPEQRNASIAVWKQWLNEYQNNL